MNKIHWNYFLALEEDLEKTSRYVEFSQNNFNVYSIEFAHLLFAAASEVDVLAKLLCKTLAPANKRKNIDDYKATLVPKLRDLTTTTVSISRYGIQLTPWDSWKSKSHPVWGGEATTMSNMREITTTMKQL